MTRPITVVTGVDPAAMEAAALSLLLDLPRAVIVRHRIDVERSVLVRLVSDLTGVLEHEEIDLDHACVPCAIREDVIPTLMRVSQDPRWETVLAHLPVGAEPDQVCHLVAQRPDLARAVRIERVVAAVDGSCLSEDLLGDTLLADRGLESSREDRRGTGEVLAHLLEYADLVVATEPAGRADLGLMRTLARPGVPVIVGPENVVASSTAVHDPAATAAWIDPLSAVALPALVDPGIWRVELHSSQPFHPTRLLDGLSDLGSGRHRSRGCFWLPTRPGQAILWDGAGGQLSVGNGPLWGRRPRQSRLVITGVGTAPAYLRPSFETMLLAPGEPAPTTALFDGLEPWLGPIQDAA